VSIADEFGQARWEFGGRPGGSEGCFESLDADGRSIEREGAFGWWQVADFGQGHGGGVQPECGGD
jgi:hypothetical protein